MNTRIPTVVHRPPEMERREAQIHDPYPDATFGPDTGFRPLGFNDQRSEPQRAKDRFFTAKLRSQTTSPLGPQAIPPQSMPHQAFPYPGTPYPGTQYQAQPYQSVPPQAAPYQSTPYYQQGVVSPVAPGSGFATAPPHAQPIVPPQYYPPAYR